MSDNYEGVILTSNIQDKYESQCDICKKSFSQPRSLVRHKRIHTGVKTYECDLCERQFSQSSHLMRHKRTVHSGIKPHQCDVCEKRFAEPGKLTRHKRIHTGEKPYECDVCKKRFSQSHYLKMHKRTHTAENDHYFEERFLTFGIHQRTLHTGDKYESDCDVCGKQFPSSSGLLRHKRTHTGERPYKCEICNKGFSQSAYLSKHKRVHTGLKPFECDVCVKRFTDSSHLARHKRTHTGLKPFECDICLKRFSQSTYIKVHKRNHTGIKPYECDVCEKRFSSTSHLQYHKKTHLLCDSCRRDIIHPKDIPEHFHYEENTGQFVCNNCNKAFYNFVTLLHHIARHHGNDASYQCGFCQELESREPTGVGYVCVVCDVVFDIPRQLEDHMVTHDRMKADNCLSTQEYHLEVKSCD